MGAAPVHVWMPPAPGAPTLLCLHGRGGNEHDLVDIARMIVPGAGVLAPRGPEPQGPGGWAWFVHQAIGVPVAESFLECRDALIEWLDAALLEYAITGPMTGLGFSNGGMMAGALVAARPDLVDAAILMSSGYALSDQIMAPGGLTGRRVLICGGEEDPFHSVETATAGATRYRSAGAEVELILEPGVGHTITRAQVQAATSWMQRR